EDLQARGSIAKHDDRAGASDARGFGGVGARGHVLVVSVDSISTECAYRTVPKRFASAPADSYSALREAFRRARSSFRTGLACSKLELVTDAVDRANQFLPRRRCIELSPEILDMAVHGAVRDDPMVSVQMIQESRPGEDTSGMLSQRAEQPELDGG